jgi:cysteinyl-tRNA synthetase
MTVRLYNSLTKKIEDLRPIKEDEVSLYTCGPTVYNHAHIGNFRAFVLGDLVNRVLTFNGYNVKYIMNLTDVGHLTDDADQGDDKLEKAAEKEGKSAREIADYYIKLFMDDYERLHLTKPMKFTRATDYISEQIELVKVLENKGYTYNTTDGVYFDTSKFPEYGQLSGMTHDNTERESRVEENSEKRNPSDFALWKLSPQGERRWQEWDSPWGMGFPGWHVECSAMSMKELGVTIDIHTGGEDHKMIHHPNEIAQSQCATGVNFVNLWMHSAFLQVDGGKISKSKGNFITVGDVIEKGFTPLALRYLYFSAHYRSPLNFTWSSLESADSALQKLYTVVEGYKDDPNALPSDEYIDRFLDILNDDLNMPKALAVMWDLIKSDTDEGVKLATMTKFDEVLGFGLDSHIGIEIPQNILDMAKTREVYRKNGIWDKADVVRREIESKGYYVEDTPEGYLIKRKVR